MLRRAKGTRLLCKLNAEYGEAKAAMRTSRLLCETHIAGSVSKECSHKALFREGMSYALFSRPPPPGLMCTCGSLMRCQVQLSMQESCMRPLYK